MIRYPWGPLAAAMGVAPGTAARLLRVSGSTWKKYRELGVSARTADTLAVRAGFHPYEVWPEMADDDIGATRATMLARQARWARRRYATDPVFRARKIEGARAYYVENRVYVLGRVAAYERANRDRINARRRARWAERAAS